MRKKLIFTSIGAIVAMGVLIGCRSTPAVSNIPDLSDAVKPKEAGATTLQVLAHYEAPDWAVEQFKALHPDIDLEWSVVKDPGETGYLNAVASEDPPDLLIVENGLLSVMSGYDLFQDLSTFPKWSKASERWYPGLSWLRYTSAGSDAIFALPKDLPAAMTFYRADILEAHGFPSEPEALAKWMEAPERWLELAEALKANGHWISSWPNDPLYISSYGRGYFHPDLTFNRLDEKTVRMIETARRLEEKQLSLGTQLWSGAGQAAIAEGKIAMFYSGEWHSELLPKWDPDTYRLWRKTRLPFGEFGVAGGNFYSIIKYSDKQEEAWSFISFMMEMEREYREGLYSFQRFDQLPAFRPTPIDVRASSIWDSVVRELLTSARTAEEIAQDAASAVQQELWSDMEALRRVQGIQP
ncbi:ABC transporter substrate-binding protein [Paenibacillus sp. TRM 82003]|nr:ABC transporter substrate-binding protein [Paenibacillus sp. TRM 82003]